MKFLKVEASEDGNVTSAPFKTYTVTCELDGKEHKFEAQALLNATGRIPNVHDIGLEVAGVEFDGRKGVLIDDYFKTSNDNVYACGDVASVFKFTHSADWSARVAIRNMFLGEKHTEKRLVIPWCTYTDPEAGTFNHSSF